MMTSLTSKNARQGTAAASVRIQAEWEPHAVLWTAWPSHPALWPGNLEEARREIAAMILALSAGEEVRVLAMGDEALASARSALGSAAKVIPGKFGDVWLRDTGPIFAAADGKAAALRFKTNGWGKKYIYEFDDEVGDDIANNAGVPIRRHDFVLEGGSLEHDGEGTVLTTRQCILNPNRNPGWSQADAETALKDALGAGKILWLDEGMLNDHTDGHIDNIARFVAPGKVLCQKAFGKDDPNAKTFDNIYRTLSAMTDARGRKLQVVQIPSPGRVESADGDIVPASHMNFIIGNKAVVLPVYGGASADEAVKILGQLFPGRKIVAASSKALLTGGGSFHCITQQVPA